MKLELLAPAQNKDCALCAINYGADAIYIGARNFGARVSASNSLEDIEDVVNYAHKFYVKVYCTVNTILNDHEILEAAELINQLYNIGVDGIIIQDMGLVELAINGKLKPIPLFASTQCNNVLPEKIKFLENIGFTRVILARELNINEITNICQKTNSEIETFIHGALCVSYSGQCYMSYSIGKRSANKGECAQPCRKKYTLTDKNGKIIAKDKYLLCLHDFNASEHIAELVNAGVSSFKIEGRLKDTDYIKNVVAYYRKKLDRLGEKTSSGIINFDFEPDVYKSFNRGFTNYFLDGKRKDIFNFNTPKSIGEKIGKIESIGQNFFVIKNHNLHAQDGLFFNYTGCLVNKIEGNKIFPNKMPDIKIGTIVYRNFNYEFNKTLKNSKTKRQIKTDLIIKNGKITITDEDLNQITIDILSDEQTQNQEKMKDTIIRQMNKTGNSDFIINTISIKDNNIPFLKISEINQLRNTLFEKLMQERLKNYKRKIQPKMQYAKYIEETVDFRTNIHNKFAKKFYEKCGSKVMEMSLESGLPVNEKPLMTTKHCLKYAFGMCKKPIDLFLTDEKNQRYKLKFDCKECKMSIYKD